MNNKDFCVLPFIHTVENPFNSSIHKSNSLICCRISHDTTEHNIDSDTINLSPTWKKIQDSFLSGEKPIECNHCWRDENNNTESYRQSMLKEFHEIIQTNEYMDKNLRYLELMFGNTCNLSCRSCSSVFSSKWNDVDQYLISNNIYPIRTENLTFTKWQDRDLSHLIKLKIMGGEPLYQKSALDLLDHLSNIGVMKNISLQFSTNGTLFLSDRWLELILESKKTQIVVSVDAIGQLNDYIRSGSSWDIVESNLIKFKNLETIYNNISVSTNTVVTAMNVNVLNSITDYCNKLQLNNYQDITSYPDYLDVGNLPDLIKSRINTSDRVKKHMTNSIGSDSVFQKLKLILTLMDQYHNMNLEDYNPEMYNLIYN